MHRGQASILIPLVALLVSAVGCKRSAPPGVGAGPDGEPETKREIPYTPTGRKVWLIGWDGLSARVLEPLLNNNRVPNLKRLMLGGAYGRLRTIVPTHSPIIWTGIATGKTADKHGITGFWHPVSAGDAVLTPEEQAQIDRLKSIGYIQGGTGADGTVNVLYRSQDRRVKALWNIVSERGLACTVVGWWVTWPAEEVNGAMVSDRFVFNRFQVASKVRNFVADRSEGLVYPPAMRAALAGLVGNPNDVTPADLGQFIDGDVEFNPDFRLHDIIDELRIVYAQDESHVRIAAKLLAESRPGLFALYIQGTDIVCHYFWKYRFPGEWEDRYEPVDPADVRRFGRVIDRYFELQDRRLGELLKRADEKTTVVLVSDHGFVTGKRRFGDKLVESISGIHGPSLNPPPPGVIVLYGAGIRPGVRLKDAHVYDVAPTVLTLLGLPVAADMDGKVLTEALEGRTPGEPVSVKYIDTYEPEEEE